MHICEDLWLSNIFGHRVFRLDLEPTLNCGKKYGPAIQEIIRGHSRQLPAAMYYTKVNTTCIDIARSLASAGFFVVDVNVIFEREAKVLLPPAENSRSSRCLVHGITPEHYNEVLSIAESCFRYSRFHLDPLIPKSIANRVKHDWVLSYIRTQRGDRLFVALLDGRPAGFLAALTVSEDHKRVAVVDLMGVHRDSQQEGVGHALAACFTDHYKNYCDIFRVGTQVANVPSIRLYEKLGFSIVKTQYVMHMHVGDGHYRPKGDADRPF